MRHEIHVFENGTATLRELSSGSLMHSSIGPLEEARQIYLEQSRLAERLRETGRGELVLYDLGLGMATNALVAIEAALAAGQRELRLLSFESDLAGLARALELDAAEPGRIPLVASHRAALMALLAHREWRAEGLHWTLYEGDFVSQLESKEWPAAELVFYDLYAPRTAPSAWGVRAFRAVRRLDPELLVTYSAATSVRAAMQVAGLRVGAGASTAIKRETTLAGQSVTAQLGAGWFDRWRRSERRYPEERDGMSEAQFEAALLRGR